MTKGTPTHMLTRRQALARVIASIALGTALAAAIASHGISDSAAKVDPSAPGTAAAQLGILQSGPVERNTPSVVQAGFDGGSADADAVRLLGRDVNGSGSSLYASRRTNGGACNALTSAQGAVGTVCVDNLEPGGITITASDADGWTLYGFAADDVVAVDVVLAGKAQPATMLPNAYVADLGSNELNAATALVVHHVDGTAGIVPAGLQAPGA
jgi:hypothetical protein